MKVMLIPASGGPPVVMNDKLLVLGRSPGCDVPIENSSVSRVHCVVVKTDDGLLVRNLESRNGIKVNGKKQQRAQLCDGDDLAVAKVHFRISMLADRPAARRADRSLGEQPASDPETVHSELAKAGVELGDWQPGLPVFKGCHLISPIGHGGFAEVWRAELEGFGEIALKRLTVGEPRQKEERAFELMRGLRHPHITRVFGICRRETELVVAMELGSQTLEDRLARHQERGHRGIPAKSLISYVFQLAGALDYLYFTRKVLHRDVKPSNVLMVGRAAKLCDFGLVKVLEQTMDPHSGVASFYFAPPEFFESKTVATSDQYSLAATYCYLLTGEHPIAGPGVRQMALQHLKGELNIEHVLPRQQAVLRQAMARNPADRFPCCTDFACHLQRAIEHDEQ